MTRLAFSAFKALADRLADELPPELTRGLNGGILVVPRRVRRGGFWILGEYVEDGMGRTILLYHGSFREVFGEEPREVWEEEIRETLVHELTHHVEALAGVDDLTREEEAFYGASED